MRSAELIVAPDSTGALPSPRLGLLDQLQDRRQRLWYSTHTLSVLAHTLIVAYFVQAGVSSRLLTHRSNVGYQFGQAVMLASPLFELGDRNMVRGRQDHIPLSALVPEKKLVEPDLRRMNLRPLDPQSPGMAAEEDRAPGLPQSPSMLSLPTMGGGGALPSGGVPERTGAGPVMPFDLVPPSNARGRKPGERELQRMVIGDSSVLGGGAREGLRLPPSPSGIGTSVEIVVESRASNLMDGYLRVLLSRLRRACFEVFPDQEKLGAPGEVVLVLTLGRAGRVRALETARSSGNPLLDSKAKEAISLTPALQPLPQNYLESEVRAMIRIRYARH